MTHEDGIEKAADEFDACWRHSKLFGIADIDAAERIIQAYLSASGMVLVPRKATDEMKFHTLVAGYLAVGSEGDEALSLAKDKMNTEGYDEFSDAQYAAMLDAAPDPFKSQP